MKVMEWNILTWIFPLLFLSGIECGSRKQKEIISLFKQIHNGPFDECTFEMDTQIGDEEIFSVFNGDHLLEAKKLYEFLMSAKSYEDFYKKSAGARCNVNADLFAYSFSVAFLRSPFTKDVILPSFYEINPFYFIKKSVLEKATKTEENNTLIDVEVNVSDITYFTEDVGLSSYYYFINLLLPFWIESNKEPLMDKNGEFYLYLHHQLLARYNLERYALGLKPTPSYDYEHPIELGYECDLMYPNGELFPSRKDNEEILYRDVLDVELTNNTNANAYTYVKDWELKLRQLIDGQNPGSYSILVENMGLIGSRNYNSGKLNYARILLGNPNGKSKTPSALEHYETSTRDPMFWPMLKRMLYFYYRINNKQYTSCNQNYYYNMLCDKVITINYFNISRLETYFDDYKIDLTNAINKKNFNIQARMKRLNHQLFNYNIGISTTRPTKVLIKVFIGPQYDQKGNPISLKNNRFNFVEIHRSVHQVDTNLQTQIWSSFSNLHSNDRIMFTDFYNNVIDGFIQGVDYEASSSMKYYGFPNRLMLPKGTKNGTYFQLYVVALPLRSDGNTKYMLDKGYDFNYPLNTPFSDEEFLGSNAHLQQVKIYHRE